MWHVASYVQRSSIMRRGSDPSINNFAIGNPHDMPLPAYVAALQQALEPQHKDWFAYQLDMSEAQAVVAASLHEKLGIPFETADITMTNAGFGALATALQAVVNPGDEVIFNLPPWFFYEILTVNAGATAVKIQVDRTTFDLDLDAIAAAITPRTRVIIVNSPNNPTGKIYAPATLERLAAILDDASRRNGRPIYLLSDEAYRRIVFDGNTFHTPLAFYPYSLMAYSYGKTLLAPGQRIGYLAMPPAMPGREQLRQAIQIVQMANGFLAPNQLLLHAIADLEPLSIDMTRMQRKRDRMVGALREMGYEVHVPEGTFYLLPKSPWEDDWAFVALMEQHDNFCLPGTVVEFPGFFRISLTANEEMIERSLPGFAAAIAHAHAHSPAR
jgi:aspartate aminotransferase